MSEPTAARPVVLDRHGFRVGAAAGAALAAATLALALLVLRASPASAHDGLVSASPAENSVVTTAPPRVMLTFDEDVAPPSVIVVTDPSGKRVQQGSAQVVAKTVSIGVQVAAPGSYTVAFRILSADGHSVTGQIAFTYRPPPGTWSPTPSRSSTAAAAVKHVHRNQGGVGNGWVIGGIAGVAVVGGFALLVLRRRALELPTVAGGEDQA